MARLLCPTTECHRISTPAIHNVSDEFERLVDVDVSAADAPAVCEQVVDRLRELGLIAGKLNSKCVLSGEGYLPGPAMPKLYQVPKGGDRFWELVTCGVEPQVGRHFNYEALGEACEGFACPACGEGIDPFDDVFQDVLGAAVDQWLKQSGKGLVACPECKKKTTITKWHCQPPLGFGHLSFSFWNWPPLDSSSWKIDIRTLVEEVTGHTIVKTYGHL